MKKYWSSRISNLIPYVPGEQPKDQIYIKLNTNENPYPPSPRVLEAIRNTAADGLRLYPDPESTKLRAVIAGQYSLRPEQVFVGNGSDEVLAFCFLALFSPGMPIVFPDITYSFYTVYADLFGIPYRTLPLNEDFSLPLAAFRGGNHGVIFPNPNAPTGRAVSLPDIEEIVKANADAAVIVDEAYVDFGAESAVGLIDRYPNLLVVHTLSKFRSLAGLRVGYAMGHADLIAALNCVKNSFNSYTTDRLALAGAQAAIEDTDYSRQMAEKINATRETTAEKLRGMGFRVIPSAANFLFVAHERVDAKRLQDALRARGILVRHFAKPRIDNYLRVSIGTDSEMERFCQAMSELVQQV